MEHVVDYAALLRQAGQTPGAEREARFGELLTDARSARYVSATSWRPQILEVKLGRLTYLFDAAPSLHDADGEDRVVGLGLVDTSWSLARRRADG